MPAHAVVALLAAYNEEDIVGPVVADLIRQGVSVHFIDHGSTDGTVAAVEPFLGRGLLQIERFEEEAPAEPGRASWEAVLRRKEELAQEIDAGWFIHQDADEFRESPWPHLDLAQAIALVDRSGHDAIDFALLDFWPTHDRFRAGDDPRETFVHCTPGAAYDRVQVRCWKKQAGPVDLVSSGGHEARFAGRRVFPIRFLLRHYPFRSRAQAERKVQRERLARFPLAEQERGWHRQYAAVPELPRDPADLTPFEPERVRLDLFLNHRGVEDLRQAPVAVDRAVAEATRAREEAMRELDDRNREVGRLAADLDTRNHEIERQAADLHARNVEIERLAADLHVRNLDVERQATDLHARNLDILRLDRELEARTREVAHAVAELEARNREAVALREEIDGRNREVSRLAAEVGRRTRELEEREAESAARQAALDQASGRLLAIEGSRTWRWSALVRQLLDRARRT